jgi:hypothetical protein
MSAWRTLWRNMKSQAEGEARRYGSEAATRQVLGQFRDDLGPTLDKSENAVNNKKADATIGRLKDKAVATIGKYLGIVEAANKGGKLVGSYSKLAGPLKLIREGLTGIPRD